jgi:hypothetical protein
MTRLQPLPALVVLAFTLSASCGSSDKPGGTGGSGGSPGGSGGATAGSGGSAGTGGTAGSGGASGSGGSAGRDAAPPPPPPVGGSGGSAGADAAGGQGGRGADAAADTGGAAAPTWDSFAKGFFTSFCVSCHNDDNSGVAARDYHLLANVMREKAEIACGVATAANAIRLSCPASPRASQFPVGNGAKPTDAERDRLVQWIQAGTP